MTTRQSDVRYSWEEYRARPDGACWELIGGRLTPIPQLPTVCHQRVLRELACHFTEALRESAAEVLFTPTVVRLSQQDVVRPDLMVCAEPELICSDHVAGAPDLVVEVLCPATVQHIRNRKSWAYARAGVPELWLVSPFPGRAEQYLLEQDFYRLATTCTDGDTAASVRFPELKIPLKAVFPFPATEDESALV